MIKGWRVYMYTPAPPSTMKMEFAVGTLRLDDINNGYIGGACPYKNNGFGGDGGHCTPHLHMENQLHLVVAIKKNLKLK